MTIRRSRTRTARRAAGAFTPVERPAMSRRGFTLVELLVVVAIIIALLAILLPSMGRAVEAAHRAVCASNMSQFGTATLAYVADHRGALPRCDPAPIRTLIDSNDVFSLTMMQRYVGGIDFDKKTVDGVWRCPSGPDKTRNFTHHWPYGFIDTWYTYFGRADTLAPAAVSHRSALVGSRIGSTGVLFAETTFYWHVNGGYTYNHGEGGPSEHRFGPFATTAKAFSGMNQCYGDGSVRWSTLDDPATELKGLGSVSAGYVTIGGVDRSFYLLD